MAGKRTAEKTIGDTTFVLETCGAITLAKVAASLAKNGRGLMEPLMTAQAKGAGAAEALLPLLLGAAGDVDTDKFIEDVVTLLAPLKVAKDGGQIAMPRERLDGYLSGDLAAFAELGWWAVQHNFPFVAALSERVRSSVGQVKPPASSVTGNSPGASPASSSPDTPPT